jgi:plastocyanin
MAAAMVATAGALGLPAVASAAHRYTAYAGSKSPTPPKSAPASAFLDEFFPGHITIRAGDRITYRNSTFHTVSTLPRGTRRPPLALPQPGATYSGINDAQGTPFFFNGMAKFIYNPQVFLPSGPPTGARVTGKFTNSGAFGGRNARYTLTFPTAGTYRIECLLHPGMEQTVRVLAKGAARRADTNAKVARAATRQQQQRYRQAARLARRATPPSPDSVIMGLGREASLLAFFPNRLTVSPGTTVTFVNRSPSEVHNTVFGPMDFISAFAKANDLLPTSANSPNQVAPPFIYGSEPPAASGAYAYDGTNHGNGFLWTPLTDDQPGNPPQGLLGATRITFTKPGTYHYFCAIHGPNMSGDIIVR